MSITPGSTLVRPSRARPITGPARKRRKLARPSTIATLLIVGVVLGFAAPAAAQDPSASDTNSLLLDNMWIFVSGVLVFLMQAGFALVESGLTRGRNVANIMAKNMADAALGIMMFFIFGYWIAFGEFLPTMDIDTFTDLGGGPAGSHATFFFFQAMFAAAAVTIASGAMAGRTKFSSYLIFGTITTAVIYPLVVRITWGGGEVFGFGAGDLSVGDAVWSDFAGSTIVHSVGAWAALVGAVMLGPRLGKYDENGNPRAIPGHNMAYTIIGVFILWFGWFGFNGGSELAMDNLVPFVLTNTALAACAGVIGATALIWSMTGKPDVGMAGNGALAGLVSITAPVGAVTPIMAMVIGFIGGLIVVVSVIGIDKARIDDPVGAISVHGVCGIWGTLSIGLFARYDDAFLGREDAGLFYGGGISQLITQLLLVVVVAVFSLVAFTIIFGTLKATVGIRASAEHEAEGLDVAEHGSAGYAVDAPIRLAARSVASTPSGTIVVDKDDKPVSVS